MAATLVAHTSQPGTSGSNTTTSAIDTTGATFLIVSVGGGPGVTLSDSKSNTWSLVSANQTNPTQSVFCSIPTSVGSGHTFTTGGGVFLAGVAVQAWSGTTGLFIPLAANSGAGTIATGGLTAPGATNANLFIAGMACDGTASATIDSSFTISDFQVGVAAQSFGTGLAYKVSAGTEAPTWTRSSGTGKNAAFLICIGVLGGGGGGGGGAYGFA